MKTYTLEVEKILSFRGSITVEAENAVDAQGKAETVLGRTDLANLLGKSGWKKEVRNLILACH